MEPVNIPLAANWNLISSTAACPDGGFLYIGFKSVNYISAIRDNENPTIKAISTRQKIKSIGCDHDWSETKYFAALADDNTIQIWDLNDGKAKRGHKAHIKTSIGDGDGPPSDLVAMNFLQNRKVLSIDSSCIVKYCISSNRYTKHKRIIANKHKINIVKGSPYDENIVAFGSTRGLIFLCNVATETIVSTFCGHSREITSLSWIARPLSQQTPRPKKTAVRKFGRRHAKAHNTTADECFDIYDFDYLENEFGAPARTTESQIQSDSENVDDDPEDAPNNENFNFIEACKSLKDEILARKQGVDSKDDEKSESGRQVTLDDCRQAIEDRQKSGVSQSDDFDSELSAEYVDMSDESLADDFEDSCRIDTTLDQSQFEKRDKVPQQDVYLASGSLDGSVWIWHTKTGESIDQLSVKGSHGQHANNYIEVSWINSNTLIMNDKSCELVVYVSSTTPDKKIKFKREKHETKQRGIVGLCKMIDSPVVWILSSRRELTCENIVTNQMLAKYSCAITGATAIRENPADMNRVAIAFPDRRICLASLGAITPKNVTMETVSLKEDTLILSLSWSPNDKYLAFGTAEGRIGVVNTEKASNPVVLMKPFAGKPVYSLGWRGSQIFACSHDKVAYYEWNGKTQHANITNIRNVSSITLHNDFLLVGTQNGDVVLHSYADLKAVSYRNVATKYISEISINPLNSSLLAVSAQSSHITILKIVDGTLELERILPVNENPALSGATWVKWSNKNENHVISCGFDGAVRIWDLSRSKQEELIFSKQFDSPMLCAIFSPINEDIIICAGRVTSIRMFNYKTEVSDTTSKSSNKKSKDKYLGDVQWGSRLESVASTKKKSKQKQTNDELDDSTTEMLERLKLVKGEECVAQDKDNSIIMKNQSTVLHLLTKEFNKDPLQNITKILDESVETSLISERMFGTREDAEKILSAELKNHQESNTKSIGRTLLPQINFTLKEEILECIKTKKLTEVHISLAPSISYDFWKNCCRAYANQLLEIGLVLNAISYLLACHEIRESIDCLVAKHFYREAWLIAKIHMDDKDPIFETLLKMWSDHIYSTGNYEGAALLHTLVGDYKAAVKCLSERRQQSADHCQIIKMLESKISP